MAETRDTSRDNAGSPGVVSRAELRAWFIAEVLPLEAALMQFLQHNWRNKNDLADLRQDVYVRVYEAAKKEVPHPVKPFVFAVARNLIIDRVRREQIVPIEAVADLNSLGVAKDEPGPDRVVAARDELRKLQAALDHLPPRAREVVTLRRIEGVPRREIASRMGITEDTVAEHLSAGMRALADLLYGGPFGREL
ncbi:MAG TPA: RNA polymerase sigma factor [Rhizomicrobium sp.]|nr:RNA polymerase sigma factor [Rhizomicrobium sp.]